MGDAAAMGAAAARCRSPRAASSFAVFALVCSTAGAAKVLVIGGTGRIGTACATHLLRREPSLHVALAGRDAARGAAACEEVRRDAGHGDVSYAPLDYTAASLDVAGYDAVVHVAGPFDGPLDEALRPLEASVAAGVPVYVDVSDPLPYLDAARSMDAAAAAAGTTALVAAGAFPGMSNVLAMRCAEVLDGPVEDLSFSYFTAGLGGSGTVNLDITNYGFGPPMARYVDGALAKCEAYAGTDLGTADYFLDGGDGRTEDVWAWPFPEAATVAEELAISGSSTAGMGTAPGAWNWMLRLLVAVVPRPWWETERFSGGMARFSEPLVKLTDAFVGEDHAMRVEASGGGRRVAAVQTHASFRDCVGQSCAEFVLDALAHPRPGVACPEARYRPKGDRDRALARLLSTPGTVGAGCAVVEAKAEAPASGLFDAAVGASLAALAAGAVAIGASLLSTGLEPDNAGLGAPLTTDELAAMMTAAPPSSDVVEDIREDEAMMKIITGNRNRAR